MARDQTQLGSFSREREEPGNEVDKYFNIRGKQNNRITLSTVTNKKITDHAKTGNQSKVLSEAMLGWKTAKEKLSVSLNSE